jgi:hypothetical protein
MTEIGTRPPVGAPDRNYRFCRMERWLKDVPGGPA